MEAEEHAPQELVHGLRWGLKKSFLDYVFRMPDGQGSVGEGAVPVGDGDLFFEHDAATAPTRSGRSAATFASAGTSACSSSGSRTPGWNSTATRPP